MVEAKIYYINLDRCVERRTHIESSFKYNNLIRISAIDGINWSTKDTEIDGKYSWNNFTRQKFLQSNILVDLNSNISKFIGLSPMEVACNLSHIKALKTFLESNDDYAIILEDDVELIKPINILEKIQFPLKGEILYLCGPNHPGDRLRLYNDGQVKWSRTLMAYVVSRKAANLMIEAAYPMCYLMDTQIMVRLFNSLEPFKKNWIDPKLPKLERFNAYGLFDPLIKHSKYAKITTFTKDGNKNYLPESAQL